MRNRFVLVNTLLVGVAGCVLGYSISYGQWYKKWEKYCAPHYGIETTCTNAYVESFLGG